MGRHVPWSELALPPPPSPSLATANDPLSTRLHHLGLRLPLLLPRRPQEGVGSGRLHPGSTVHGCPPFFRLPGVPTNGSHRPSTAAEERAPYHHQSSNRPRRTHREEGGQHSPFILVRGARRWLKRRTVLRDLRDCFLVPIPTDTWEYRGPHGQVLLHLPSASTAKSLVETQDRWLSISRRYSFQPYDPSSQDLHDTTRRAWIREMRYVQGTSHLFTNV